MSSVPNATIVEWLESSKRETFTSDDLDRYRAAWDRERGLTGMINWYLALFRDNEDPPTEQVDGPTLVIWGESEEYLLTEMAHPSLDYCAADRLERIPDGTHRVHHEHTARVTDLLVEHFG